MSLLFYFKNTAAKPKLFMRGINTQYVKNLHRNNSTTAKKQFLKGRGVGCVIHLTT